MAKNSVVISTYSKERLSYLLDCIESLKKQSLKPDEIVLVLDPYPNLVEFYKSKLSGDVRVVVSRKPGLSNARNAGVRSARGDIVSFIDDDAVADEYWLENLAKNFEDSNVIGAGGFVKPLWEDGYPRWFPEELNWIVGCSYKGLPEHKASVRNPIGCNMSFRKSVFEQVGYFRSDIGRFGKKLLASEETELSMRALSTIPNSKIIYDPSAIVHHKINKRRGNLKYVWVRSFYEGLSKAIISHETIPSTKLSTEMNYFKYLLSVAIPLKCKKIYRFEELSKLLTLLLSLTAVGTGFVAGKPGEKDRRRCQ
jgi:GT2 family glycosyltransferase